MKTGTSILFLFALFVCACNKPVKKGDEQIHLETVDSIEADSANLISGSLNFNQLSTFPSEVILTGMADHRLIGIYRKGKKVVQPVVRSRYYSSDAVDEEYEPSFIPGIELLYGYNLLNLAHFDLRSGKTNYLFPGAVLVKTLYYPCNFQDSLFNKPVNRNFFLVSVYDEDTNGDTLISRRDLRKIYHFDSTCTVKTSLLPAGFSAYRSQYDASNDVMYIYAGYDENRNGTYEKKEKTAIFWISMRMPGPARRVY